MTDTILETEGLTREFSGFVAVDAVDLRVETGTIHALIGPNGAGKTTCFNLLTSFLPPTRGKIKFKGRDITGYEAGNGRQAGPGPQLPDLRRVPASDRAGECAPGAAARPRRQLRFLALRERAARYSTTVPTSYCSTSGSPRSRKPWLPTCPMA